MTALILLDSIIDFTNQAVKDIILPAHVEEGSNRPTKRPADVHRMFLPEITHFEEAAPFIIIRYLSGTVTQPAGQYTESEATIQFVFCTYEENRQEGEIALLNLMTHVSTKLLQQRLIGRQFEMQNNLEQIVYPDNTAPYYSGEFMTTWSLPPIEREVNI